jgi:hypothetical protein
MCQPIWCQQTLTPVFTIVNTGVRITTCVEWDLLPFAVGLFHPLHAI